MNGHKKFFSDATDKIHQLRAERQKLDRMLTEREAVDYMRKNWPDMNFADRRHFWNVCESRINHFKIEMRDRLKIIHDQEKTKWIEKETQRMLAEDRRLSLVKELVV